MTPSLPVRRPSALAANGALAALTLFATLAVPGAAFSAIAEPEPKSCDQCCMLPCIEAQLWEAGYKQNRYKELSKQKGLTKEKYEQRESEFSEIASFMRAMYTGQNLSCQYYLPKEDPIILDRVIADYARKYGYVMNRTGGEITSINFSPKMDPEKCELTKPEAKQFAPKVTPCSGMGEAIVAHEQKHIDDCAKRKNKARTPQETAQDEVAGYQAEIDKLQEMRKKAAEPCSKKSCEETKAAFDRTARLIGTDIDKILGITKKKPASASPMARGAKKGG